MIVPLPKDIDTPRALYIMDEMGSMKKAYTLSRPEKKIFILGDGLLNMLFYTAVARKAVGRDGYIVAAVYKGAMQSLSKNEIKRILEPYADHVYFTDILKPLDCYESFRLEEPELFDLSINCANMLGGEALSVMLTKTRGDILFTSLTSNFNSVALFAESLGKELRLTPIEEFSSGSLEFNLDFVREIKSDIDMIDEIFKSHRLIKQLPMRVSELNNTQDIDNIDKVEGFVFGSNKTKKILMEVINIAAYDCNVIIQGETGTGKEKILNLIYKNSIRKTKPCIKINCATIHENLAESEFFGYEPGAFTGAGANRKLGYFELANGGILFLRAAAGKIGGDLRTGRAGGSRFLRGKALQHGNALQLHEDGHHIIGLMPGGLGGFRRRVVLRHGVQPGVPLTSSAFTTVPSGAAASAARAVGTRPSSMTSVSSSAITRFMLYILLCDSHVLHSL